MVAPLANIHARSPMMRSMTMTTNEDDDDDDARVPSAASFQLRLRLPARNDTKIGFRSGEGEGGRQNSGWIVMSISEYLV